MAAEHDQDHNIWCFENGFLKILISRSIEDLKGLPPILVNTIKNISQAAYENGPITLEITSAPPEWIKMKNEEEILPAFHFINIGFKETKLNAMGRDTS